MYICIIHFMRSSSKIFEIYFRGYMNTLLSQFLCVSQLFIVLLRIKKIIINAREILTVVSTILEAYYK